MALPETVSVSSINILPTGCEARLLLAFLAHVDWLSTARATCLWQQTSATPPRGVIPRFLKITRGGAQNAFATIPDSFFAQGVAIDRSDNLFVMAIAWSNTVSIIYKLTPEEGRRSFGVVPGHGFGLVFDSGQSLRRT